jgi:hypothetical protein
VGLVGIAAIDLSGGDHAQRRLVRAHETHLHARGVGAQQAAVGKIEGVVHGPRRMVRREVQGLEVVVVVLDLRAIGELVAQAREDVGDALEGARDRVQVAQLATAAGQSHVNALGGQALCERRVLKHEPARCQCFGDSVLCAVHGFARQLALLGRQCAQLLELARQTAGLAQQRDPQRFERLQARGGADLRQRGLGEAI